MLYLTCTTISSVDLAEYGVSLAKDWVSEECGTNVVMHPSFNSYVCTDFLKLPGALFQPNGMY